MDVINRIDELMKLFGWSDYRLSQESGLSQSTIANMRRRGSVPSVSTIETICKAFGITLSQFFSENNGALAMNDEQAALIGRWLRLSGKQRGIVLEIMDEFVKTEQNKKDD